MNTFFIDHLRATASINCSIQISLTSFKKQVNNTFYRNDLITYKTCITPERINKFSRLGCFLFQCCWVITSLCFCSMALVWLFKIHEESLMAFPNSRVVACLNVSVNDIINNKDKTKRLFLKILISAARRCSTLSDPLSIEFCQKSWKIEKWSAG